MKTNNDYQMFFQGYLEALTDIDGDQREFGVYVRMFDSSNKDHIKDIEKAFRYKEPIEVLDFKSSYRNDRGMSHILEKFIFLNLFNGAKISPKKLQDFKDYVIFHLCDYINFSFSDFDVADSKDIEWIYQRRVSLIAKRGEKINTIFIVISSPEKKLVFRFYRNKKYMSDKAFDKWYQKLFAQLDKIEREAIQKDGVSKSLINAFHYKEYDKEEILDVAEQISICEPKKSKSIEKICAKEEWKLKKLIPLFVKGLNDIYGKELQPVEESAKWRVISSMWRVGYKNEMQFQKRLRYMLKAIKVYNQKFHTTKNLKKYKANNRYGYAISPDMHTFLRSFKRLIDKHKNDEDIAKALQQKYQKESMKEVWREINSRLREIKVTR